MKRAECGLNQINYRVCADVCLRMLPNRAVAICLEASPNKRMALFCVAIDISLYIVHNWVMCESGMSIPCLGIHARSSKQSLDQISLSSCLCWKAAESGLDQINYRVCEDVCFRLLASTAVTTKRMVVFRVVKNISLYIAHNRIMWSESRISVPLLGNRKSFVKWTHWRTAA